MRTFRHTGQDRRVEVRMKKMTEELDHMLRSRMKKTMKLARMEPRAVAKV